MVSFKQGWRPAEESAAGDYRIHKIDPTVPVECASLARFRIDGNNEQPLLGPSLHGKLFCYDLPPV
jgi:hypothetical protein